MAYTYDLMRQQHHEKQVLINYTFAYQGQTLTLMKARVEADYNDTQLLDLHLFLQLTEVSHIQTLEPWLHTRQLDTAAALSALQVGAKVGILEAQLKPELLAAPWPLTPQRVIKDWESSQQPFALSDLSHYAPVALRITEFVTP